jgi:hypothetical protein
MTRVDLKPELLRWACERAGYEVGDLAPRFPQLPAWERGDKRPTFKQLEAFAKAAHIGTRTKKRCDACASYPGAAAEIST